MNEEDLLLIQKSIEGDLTEAEKITFEEKLQQSEEFSKEVKLQKEILAHTEAHLRSKRKVEMLADFRSISEEESTKTIPVWRYFLYAAAAVIIIIGLFSIFNISPSGTSEIYAAYYKPYDGVVNTRGTDSEVFKGITLYQQGNYQQALNLILQSEEIPEITDGQKNLLIANCLLNLDQAGKSIEYLNQISKDENQLITENTKWYLAMSYLALDNLKAAREQLENLSNSQSAYAKKSSQLLEENIFK